MRAGRLRHCLVLQSLTSTDNVDGTTSVAPVDVATVWADVTTSGGREFYNAKRLTPELTHQVEIRYRSGIVGGMRILFGATVLRIQAAVDPDGRRVRLLLMCQELVQ